MPLAEAISPPRGVRSFGQRQHSDSKAAPTRRDFDTQTGASSGFVRSMSSANEKSPSAENKKRSASITWSEFIFSTFSVFYRKTLVKSFQG
jgi:hypothetical protein